MATPKPDAAAVPAEMFAVGGTVSGLAGGQLVLRNNGVDDLTITADGAFKFSTKMIALSSFQVKVAQQPTGPFQTCVVTSTSTVVHADVTDVAVVCTTNRHVVGGTVIGLMGAGLVLQNNDGDDLAVAADGTISFATSLASGDAFTVKISHQPEGPSQTCQVAGSSGTIGGADVTSVVVNCATNRFVIGGTVTGLAGTGLELMNNGDQAVSISANGTFGFPTPLASGAAFAVTVSAQPRSPAQTCTVSSGTGNVVAGNVTAVVVDCTINNYAVGGQVSGLSGGGLILQNNLGDNLSVDVDGAFTFPSKVASSGAFDVTVLAQPTSPGQTCAISAGGGLIEDMDWAAVTVTCITNQYIIGGTVIGFAGSGLILRNNGGDDQTITANGSFAFATTVASGAAFQVTIASQPVWPTQTCIVSGASGDVVAADVSSVTIDCDTNSYTVGGNVGGLAGTGLAVALNDGAPIAISANGGFSFPTSVISASLYAVTITSQPTSPWQSCSLALGSGTIVSADVTNIAITCTTNSYVVRGTVSGLAGSGLKLRSGGADLAIAANGAFVFPTPITSGETFSVSVATQPSSLTQTCTVSGATGVVSGGDITGVAVTCVTNRHHVSGTISGLAGQVVLNDNGDDPLVVNANGSFQFGIQIASGGQYQVTVTTQPATPSQVCTVAFGGGTVIAADITDVVVTCVTNRFAVGGTITGLLGSGLTLRNNGGDDLTVSASGTFLFANPVTSGDTYAIAIATQPLSPTQTCVVTGDSGSVGGADVTSVAVNCTTTAYTIGGTVTGLAGSGLVLQNNDGTGLEISGDGTFAFPAPVASGGAYLVSVSAQPTLPSQTCSVSAGSGTVGAGNIQNVTVTCAANECDLMVNVTGLSGGGLVLQNNGGDNLAVSSSGTSTFSTAVLSGASYNVTVLTQPTSPWQTCTVSSPTGTVAGVGVTISVNCTTNGYTVGGTVSNMGGTGLVIQNNNGADLTINANGVFTFPVSVSSGGSYAVTIKTQPTGIGCTVTAGSGTMAGANVTTVSVNCLLPNGPALQCAYAGIGAYRWDNLGAMTWKSCVVEASKRGALLVSMSRFTAANGWGAHRLGANAQYMTSPWHALSTQSIANNLSCVVGRDPRPSTPSAPLASVRYHDGLLWRYQDFGAKFYDECQLLASNAGAMVITPYTMGLTGDNYWLTSSDTCNTNNWVTGGGTSLGNEATSNGVRSSSHLCMVGFAEFYLD